MIFIVECDTRYAWSLCASLHQGDKIQLIPELNRGLRSTPFLIRDEQMLSEHPPTRRIITAQIQGRSHGVVHSVVSDKKKGFLFIYFKKGCCLATRYHSIGSDRNVRGEVGERDVETGRGEGRKILISDRSSGMTSAFSQSHWALARFCSSSSSTEWRRYFLRSAQQGQMQWSMWE